MNVLKKLRYSILHSIILAVVYNHSHIYNNLPVDYLKIDGFFVMDTDKDPVHYAMVKSINEIDKIKCF